MESPETLVADATELIKLEHEIVHKLNNLALPGTARMRAIRREISSQINELPGDSVVDLALRLLSHEGILFRIVAYELVHYHRMASAVLNTSNLRQLGKGIDSWAAVDTFACYLSGPAWRRHQVPDSTIKKWAHSGNRWWRRAAVVSTVALNNKARGGQGDVNRTLLICRTVLEDRDDMVVKALSWALRELAKREPELVEIFITENEYLLAPRVLREVRNKLTTGLKNPKGIRR